MQWPEYATQPSPAVFQSGWMDCRHGYTYGQAYDVGYYEYTYQLQCRQYCQPTSFESMNAADWGGWEDGYQQRYRYEGMSYCPAGGYSQVKIVASVLGASLLYCQKVAAFPFCKVKASLGSAKKNSILQGQSFSNFLFFFACGSLTENFVKQLVAREGRSHVSVLIAGLLIYQRVYS